MKTLSFLLILSVFVSCSSSSEKKISKEDKRANIFYAQGTRNLVDKEYTKALKNLLEANSYRSNDTKIHTNLGMAYYFKKDKNLALKHLKYALELDPKNTDAKLNIATIYMESRKFDQAESMYQDILKDLVYEQQFRTYFNLGILEQKREHLDKALSYFKKSVEINENYCPSFFQMGKIYYYKKANYKRAHKMFKEASMGTCYSKPEPQYMQALSLIKMEEYAKARLKLEEMTERFALTKYEVLARKTIAKIKELQQESYTKRMKAQNYSGNILTPDF